MTQVTVFAQASRLLALACALLLPTAVFADDYTDVNQLLRSGKFAEALAKADQYIAARPRDPQMRFLKGVVQTEAGRPADAKAGPSDNSAAARRRFITVISGSLLWMGTS
jgi:hypothetical protein